MKHLHPVGTPVLIIGNPCKFRTFLGLFGFVEAIHTDTKRPDAPASYHVNVLKYPTLDDKREQGKEQEGRFESTTAFCKVSDLAPLTDPVQLERVNAFKKAERKEQAKRAKEPCDSVIDSIMRDACDPVKRRAEAKTEKLIAAHAKIERSKDAFQLPGKVERGDKGGFPAFDDIQHLCDERMGYAHSGKPVKDMPLRDRARWKLINQIVEQTSFWHATDEVRAAVKEFDLDPFADQFNSALYVSPYRFNVYAVAGTLRAEIVKLWNAGAIILDIEGMDDAEHIAKRGEQKPAGYLIRYGMRRQLPTL